MSQWGPPPRPLWIHQCPYDDVLLKVLTMHTDNIVLPMVIYGGSEYTTLRAVRHYGEMALFLGHRAESLTDSRAGVERDTENDFSLKHARVQKEKNIINHWLLTVQLGPLCFHGDNQKCRSPLTCLVVTLAKLCSVCDLRDGAVTATAKKTASCVC